MESSVYMYVSVEVSIGQLSKVSSHGLQPLVDEVLFNLDTLSLLCQ